MQSGYAKMASGPNQPFPVALRVRMASRDPGALPSEREALVRSLFDRLVTCLPKGSPQPACVAFSRQAVTQYDLDPLVREGMDLHRFISSVAGAGEFDTVGIIGVLRPRERRPPLATVFLEDDDGRWWHLWAAVDELEGKLLGEPRWARAEEGVARPTGLGGWWSRARSQRLRLQMDGAHSTIH